MSKGEFFIDVSNWQAADLTQLTDQIGVKKAIIKVSEYEDLLNKSKDSQTATVEPVGFYHFARFRNAIDEAERETKHFLDNIPDGHKGLYGVLDYEADIMEDTAGNTAAILKSLDMIADTGYIPLLYIGYDFYKNGAWNRDEVAAKYPNVFWVASYRDLDPIDEPDYNWVPQGDNIIAWQFTPKYKGHNLDCSVWLKQ